MASRSVSAAALLAVVATAAVFQATSAYVIPEVVLMRVKRNPEPMRSFSFSGFNPNGQMSAFTGLAEYPMFGGSYGQQPPSPYNYGPQPATQDAYGSPAATQDSYGPPPSGLVGQQAPAGADSANKQQRKSTDHRNQDPIQRNRATTAWNKATTKNSTEVAMVRAATRKLRSTLGSP
ncbi:unnamed protein product [Aphis gossypii]|uniref:Uncharacterized protein n=1 Tax=Aphis gossypii TaxID=80765 RepID=A0A9P0J0E5_APHGO|nr:unnamed protein product [Aphis gossypii]